MNPRMTRTPSLSETLAETLYSQTALRAQAVTPKRRWLAGLTAGLVALSVVLTSALPARADDDTDDLLAALAALAVIGVIIGEAEKDKAEPVEHDTPTLPAHPRPPTGRLVPTACAIVIEGRDHNDVVFYTESCLRRSGVTPLPTACSRGITFYGRKDWVYGEPCLRHAGYRLESDLRPVHERPD